ncbi:hypothetical protein SLEP1_g22671 [Rubroshorea leprosula]|uniref:Uncharacterized protein n=1 Tax=Rubroshorea leprosula TaxID=152421 RepID=A0AAV5JLX3_9ROSI|nr:hypothetical protein SLEP1_g22671 [Rubroshorea leprosula]
MLQCSQSPLQFKAKKQNFRLTLKFRNINPSSGSWLFLTCFYLSENSPTSVEAMHKTSEEASEVKVKKGSPKVAVLSFLPEKRDALIHLNASATPVTSTALEGMKGECSIHSKNAGEDESDHGFSSQNILVALDGRNHLASHHHYSLDSESVHVSSDIVNEELIFSIGDPHHSDKEAHENSDSPLCADFANDSGDHTPPTGHLIVKSCSMLNILSSGPTFTGCSPKYLAPSSRSSEDLQVLEMRHYSALTKDWVLPITDEVKSVKNLQEQLSTKCWDEAISSDFKFKQIEEWVNDIQHYSSVEETDDLFHSNDDVNREPSSMNGLTVTRAASVTAGALPRGLHILNLSKNNISTIGGLRGLTQLRVLDLSYKHILRIGHGLASCSSLKELYLAGNRICEVEGLHRLLKLTVLDLRFNKISTNNCLGQLAANYNSLQAISLEGNPAQKNVGDEQLKKYVRGLLPHLSYFNRQPIKISTLKDFADRSVRLGIGGSLQFDCSLRSDHKVSQKSGHVGTHRQPSTSTRGPKKQAVVSTIQSRGRRGCMSPSVGARAAANHRHHYFDFGSKLLNLKSELSIRRS